MSVTPIPEDEAILVYERAQVDLRAAKFPALIEVEVTDDDETFKALRCPRCGNIIVAGDLFAVSPAEHWAPSDDADDDAFDHRRLYFDSSERAELDETLYYKHGYDPGHAVSLPEGWSEDWF